ncbi:MotA/TolQ/ExbB proton channel family protein [Burkholderia sp. Bp8998]|uniref:MotA/TolQ/ExbB proton channel family protein n=1 Tax=Burkholderia sp. Bp8998 TaxID=2184557 RepID=UPI000F59FDDB|nr:MotA/TolQ/ExbB proton channel family protein [Burkholderia sp. Bp8998]RQS08894.1 MotA/TolQ/ExbB proton channel family protein [Burkholderia sp. Bp8998]
MADYIHYAVVGAFALLAMLSALTWTLIVAKALLYARVALGNRRFAARRGDRAALSMPTDDEAAASLNARLQRAVCVALRDLEAPEPGAPATLVAWDRRELLERTLARAIRREQRPLERGLTALASIANVAPFVGLFGTVFGIVHTLQAMTASPTNGIDAIAGPIGQALVATGIGIGVAIPAVLAYNLFLRRLKTVTAGLDEFGQDLIALAEQRRFRIDAPVHAALSAASNAGGVRRAAV